MKHFKILIIGLLVSLFTVTAVASEENEPYSLYATSNEYLEVNHFYNKTDSQQFLKITLQQRDRDLLSKLLNQWYRAISYRGETHYLYLEPQEAVITDLYNGQYSNDRMDYRLKIEVIDEEDSQTYYTFYSVSENW